MSSRREEKMFMENLESRPELSKRSFLSVPAKSSQGIVVFSHLRWSFVWQRPQQFLSRFAIDHPILFIEEPYFDLAEGAEGWLEMDAVAPQVMVAAAHLDQSLRGSPRLGDILRGFARRAIDSFNMKGEFDLPLLWYYTPMDATWSLDYFANSGVIYDCMDELSKFRGAPPELVEAEQFLLKRASVVFTGGFGLWLEKQRHHPFVHFFGCGVESEHFGQARLESTPTPKDLQEMPKPIIGWFGVIDERVDYDLIEEIAKARPDWSIVMVGPVVKVDPEAFPQAPNLHWLGGRNYSELPGYCKAFDVCIMPFALNEATEFINPTKALEYLATGKPVISTPVPDVVRQYDDLVYIEKDARGFIDRIEEVWKRPDEARIRRGVVKAEASSWDKTVSRMQALIAEVTENEPAMRSKASLK